MKNLAIIIGITDYADVNLQLPACKNDVEVMEILLRTGDRFSDVITIPSADSQTLKSELATVIGRFSQEDIDNLLFYFTGHGDYVSEDFVYQLRDYNKVRVAQTSLSNEELDGMLHSLNPNVLIKVVDACNSGMPYIKDGTTVSSYLADVIKGTFPKCYFFFSSQNDQKSYAGSDISDFTGEFAAAIASSQSETVRYKDVIDYISDSFARQRKQIPQFVAQAAFTEILGVYSASAKERIGNRIPQKKDATTVDFTEKSEVAGTEMAVTVPGEPPSLVEIARRSAREYVTIDAARKIIVALQSRLASGTGGSELDDLYTYETKFHERYLHMPNEGIIGKWLENNKSGEYFASPVYSNETYDAPDFPFGLHMLGIGHDSRKVKKTRSVISGVNTALKGMPFLAYTISLNPLLPNLLQYGGTLTYLLSKTTIQIFYCFTDYREVSWDGFEPGTSSSWVRKSFKLAEKSNVDEIAEDFFTSLSEWTLERVRSRVLRDAELDYDNMIEPHGNERDSK